MKNAETIIRENPNLTGSEILKIIENQNKEAKNDLDEKLQKMEKFCDDANKNGGIYYKLVYLDGNASEYHKLTGLNVNGMFETPTIYSNLERIIYSFGFHDEFDETQINVTADIFENECMKNYIGYEEITKEEFESVKSIVYRVKQEILKYNDENIRASN